jgi:hypothetical protein
VFHNRVEKTDTGIIYYLQEIIDNASTRKVKVKGGFKYGISKAGRTVESTKKHN